MAKDIKEVREYIEKNSETVEKIINEIVSKYSEELDNFIKVVKNVLERVKAGEMDDYPDHALEMQTIKLPILMYYAGTGLEYLGAESDVAKAHRAEEYNKMLMKVTGTIPDKQAKAEQATITEAIMEQVYLRAYKMLKIKFETADKLFSALKKVLSKRIQEIDIGRREAGLPNSGGVNYDD